LLEYPEKYEAQITVITLGQTITDRNKQMITLSELPFPLNETSFRKWDFVQPTQKFNTNKDLEINRVVSNM